MKTLKYIFLLVTVVSFTISCSGNEQNNAEKAPEQMKTPTQEHTTNMKNATSELIRKGEIDVASIDKNGDGKVFECPMDWNVISDHPGDCPVCGMHLKEFSIAETESNLEKYGYKVKPTGK